jgi:hypothetical protein
MLLKPQQSVFRKYRELVLILLKHGRDDEAERKIKAKSNALCSLAPKTIDWKPSDRQRPALRA